MQTTHEIKILIPESTAGRPLVVFSAAEVDASGIPRRLIASELKPTAATVIELGKVVCPIEVREVKTIPLTLREATIREGEKVSTVLLAISEPYRVCEPPPEFPPL